MKLSLWAFHTLSVLLLVALAIGGYYSLSRYLNIYEWNQWAKANKTLTFRPQLYEQICTSYSELLRISLDNWDVIPLYFDWLNACDNKTKCWRMGTNWHHVFLLTAYCCLMMFAVVLILQLSLCIATLTEKMRGCQLLCWLAAIIALYATLVNYFTQIWLTGKYRYAPAGQLCSMIDWPSYWNGRGNMYDDGLSDEWTFAKDG